MNNQYILITKYAHSSEAVYLNTDREFLERLVDDTFPGFKYARLYKVHYPLTVLVRSWENEEK